MASYEAIFFSRYTVQHTQTTIKKLQNEWLTDLAKLGVLT